MIKLFSFLEDRPVTAILGFVLTIGGMFLENYAHSHVFPEGVGAALIAIGVALANLGRSLIPTPSNPKPFTDEKH